MYQVFFEILEYKPSMNTVIDVAVERFFSKAFDDQNLWSYESYSWHRTISNDRRKFLEEK